MAEVSVEEQSQLSSSSPEEAAKNINNANLLSIDPSAYKQNAPELDKEVKSLEKPSTNEQVVAQFGSQSTEHRALVDADSGVFDYLARQGKMIGDYVSNRPSNAEKIVKLRLKQMDDPKSFTEEDQFQVDILNEESKDLANRNYGINGPIEKLPAEVLGFAADFVRPLTRNGELIAATTATGAGIGWLLPVPGGTVAGAAEGFVLGTTAAYFKDNFDMMTGSMYNELSIMTKDDGTPINMDPQTKNWISGGVGLISGALQAAVGKTVMTKTPFLAKWLSPRGIAKLVADPATEATRQTILNIGRSFTMGFGAGGLTEAARILGEELGKSYDGSEVSFMNALHTASENMGENAKRIGSAALISGTVAGGITAATNIIGRKSMIDQISKQQVSKVTNARDVTPAAPEQLQGPANPDRPISGGPAPGGDHPDVKSAIKALHLQDALENMSKEAKSTKMSDLAPSQLTSLKKLIFENGGIKKLFIMKEDLAKWATDDKKGKQARDSIDPSGVAAAQMNAPLPIGPEKLMSLAREDSSIFEHVKLAPDQPSPMQAREFLEALQKAHGQREEVMSKLGLTPEEIAPVQTNVTDLPVKPKEPPLTADQTTEMVRRADVINQALELPSITEDVKANLTTELGQIKKRIQAHYQLGEPGKLLVADWGLSDEEAAQNAQNKFFNTQNYTEAIKSVVPEGEVAKFDAAEAEGKLLISNAIKDAAEYEMLQVQDVEMEYAREVQREEEIERALHDPNLAVVEKFRREVILDKAGKAKSIYTIDPKTLSDDQLKYLDAPRIKEHKVFGKAGEGLSPDQAARDIGISSGDELLKILSDTPTRKQLEKARLAFHEAHTLQRIKDSVDLNHIGIIKAFNDKTGNAIKLMKFMREKKWPATKQAIKRIALPLPTVEEIQLEAKNFIAKTLVGDLNVQQYRIGERQSKRIAVNAILKMEPEKAFLAKEAEAKNIQMQKETMLAIGKVNRVRKFAKFLDQPEVRREFKNAGKMYEDAANELLDSFNLNPSKKDTAITGSYQKWVKKQYETGNGDFGINPELSDLRQSANEMTTEAMITVGDRLRALYHSAKMANKLYNEYRKEIQVQTIEAIAAKIDELAKAHPAYDEKRLPSVQETKRWRETIRGGFGTAESMFSNMEFVLKELDQEKNGGFFQEVFFHALKGDGKFDKKSGYSLELEYTKALKKVVDKHVETYGKNDFEKLNSKILKIKEFENSRALQNGHLTKADLLVLWAYGGDPEGRMQRGNNHGVTNEVIQAVLDRELEKRDVVLVQKLVDIYKTYRKESQVLQKEMTGQDVDFVEGVPNKWRGEVYPGGYVPIKHAIDYTAEAIKHQKKALENKKAAFFGGPDGEYYARLFAAEQTEQGRLEARTGSDKPLDLSFKRFLRGHEEVFIDLAYRKAVRDSLALLKHPGIRENMIKVVGAKKFGIVVNTAIEMANRTEAENRNYFADEGRFLRDAIRHVQSNFSVNVLALNPTSAIIQSTALLQLVQNMGPTAAKHIILVNTAMLKNPTALGGYYEFAVELDPTIGHFLEQIQNKITSVIHDMAPKRRRMNGVASFAKDFHTWTVNTGMAGMAATDVLIKIQGALAAYSQFINGDVEGYSLEVLSKMTDEEKYQKAQAYVRQISRTSLTHGRDEDKAPFQKLPLGGILSNYWNDSRNILNNLQSQRRKVQWEAGKAKEDIKSGDYQKAAKRSGKIFGIIAATVALTSLGRFADDYIHGRQTPLDQDFDLNSKKGVEEAAQWMFEYMLWSPADVGIEHHPIIRDINYGAFKKRYGKMATLTGVKDVQLPMTKVFDDAATSANAIAEYIGGTRDLEDMSMQQVRALMNTLSVFTFPIPVNAYYKFDRWKEERDESKSFIGDGGMDRLREELKKGPPKGATEEYKKEFEELDKHLGPKDTGSVPPATRETIKYATSGGDWTKKDPKSSAAGLYQFTEDQWKDIMTKAPELGLTEGGRVAKDSLEQDLAMDWSTQNNAERLHAAGIESDEKSLLGSHLLGVENYIKVSKATADTKLKTLIGKDERFDFKTVGQLREHINHQLSKGQKHYKDLTLTTGKNENNP